MPFVVPPYIPEGYAAEVVDVDGGDIRRHVVGKSVRLWWEQAVQCPCRSVQELNGVTRSTGEPSSTCTFCSGAGIMYVNGQQIVAMMTSTSESSILYHEYGQYAKGTAWLTLLPEHVADYLDRYTLLDGIRTHGEIRRRRATADKTRYPIIRRTFPVGAITNHSAKVYKTVGVQWCMAAGADGVTTGVELVEGTDFEVDADGKVDWTLGDELGTAPAEGELYSIRYYARPRMVLDDHTYLRRDLYAHEGGELCLTPLPVRVLVLLDYLGGNPPNAEENPQPTSEMR